MSLSKDNCRVKGRIWIETGNEALIGEGKAKLLERTAELGSLRKAAGELGISYRQAWYSLNKVNKAAGKPLLILRRGGKNGGTAIITPFGQEVLTVYRELQAEFEMFLQNQCLRLNEKISK
jgi:molybdate transport system regulatory protein